VYKTVAERVEVAEMEDRAERRVFSTVGDYVVSLSPWAGYVVFTNLLGSWRYGFAVGLALSAAIVGWRSYRRDSRFLDVGTLAYCAAMTALSTVDPTSPVRPYNLPLSMAAVGGLSTGSIVAGSPFTYRIASRRVPPAVLRDPDHHRLLYRAHLVATSSWAVAQGVAAAASAVCVAIGATAAAITLQAVGTLVPVAVTRFQHERVARARPAAASAVEVSPEAVSPEAVRPAEVTPSVVSAGSARPAAGNRPRRRPAVRG
jgi:hypothetical protein